MRKINSILHSMNNTRLKNWLRRHHTRLRFQPIRIFCIHNVSDYFDADSMWPCDWIQTDVFKRAVLELQKKSTFISLTEAQRHLRRDIIRFRKYAVLTGDDGFASLKNIIPWLEERQIPITLFINPIVWDGKTVGQNLTSLPVSTENNGAKDIYLLPEDLKAFKSPLVTFGYHGYEHINESVETYDTFVANFEKCRKAMKILDNVIPFYAHTYGRTTKQNDEYLIKQRITPVYVNGGKNYNQWKNVDRELLPVTKDE